jgi:hypothetical protein
VNGYVRISINGSECGLKFGHLAHKSFWEVAESRWNVYSGTKETLFSQYGWAKYFHCAYVNNCVLKEIDPVFSYEDFVEWVEAAVNDPAVMGEVQKAVKGWEEAETTQDIIRKLNAATQTEDRPKKSKKKGQ